MPGLVAVAVLAAALGAACAEADDPYPPFRMTYTVGQGVISTEPLTWELDYRSADDWTKTVVLGAGQLPEGQTARWDGSRLTWSTSPDDPWQTEDDLASASGRVSPERWLGRELPGEHFEEVESALDGMRAFRRQYPIVVNGERGPDGVEIVTVDAETGLPLRVDDWLPPFGSNTFVALELAVGTGASARPVRTLVSAMPGGQCGRGLCLSDEAVVAGRTEGVDVVAWGFSPGHPVLLRSSNATHDRVEQRLHADGTVRLWLDPHSLRPPGAEFALVQATSAPASGRARPSRRGMWCSGTLRRFTTSPSTSDSITHAR
jgi:hypothetical protein